MDLAVTNCKLLRYMLGNCTLVMARGEGNQRGGYGLATNLLKFLGLPFGVGTKSDSWVLENLRPTGQAGSWNNSRASYLQRCTKKIIRGA